MNRAASRALTVGWILASGACGQALAQPPAQITADTSAASVAENGLISYPPSFFAEYRPTTAQDMIGRIPGFNASRGDDVRGFGGAAGNILIDGERPSSKTVSADEALRRIQPNQVERIDLIRGSAPGIDMQGQAVVANVIRRKGAETSVTFEYMGKIYNDHPMGYSPRLDGATRIGDLRLNGTINARLEKQQGDSGNGNFFRRNGAGAVIASGPFYANVEQRTYSANGAAEYNNFRLNIGAQRDENPRVEYADLISNLGVKNTEKTVNDLNTDKAEIGGDYQHPLPLGMTGRLIGLYTYKDSDLASVSTGRGLTQSSTKRTDGSESIMRGTARGLFQGVTVETGGEIAINVLNVASTLTTGGVPVRLPSANVRIAEQRGEAFINGSAKPVPKLSIDAGIRVETSTITQSGDVAKQKTLTFPKPRMVVAYETSKSGLVRLRLERTVGQLNFEDFAASGDLSAGVLNVGNSNLEPERAYVSELAYEQRFWNKGALVLTVTHSAVQQVSDVVPIISGTSVFDAPGNLGDGTKDEFAANITLPFDNVGLKGLLLRSNWTWRRSRVKDPTTGVERPFSMLNPWDGYINLSQDFPKLKSTLTLSSMSLGNNARQFRSSETRYDATTPYFNINWQYRPRPDLLLMLQWENFFSRERRRERVIYSGSRARGIVASSEQRSAEMEPFIMFRMRKSF